jgi:putative transposase
MKPKAYTNCYCHLVFAVKYRESILNDNLQTMVFSYMSGIINGMKQKPIIIKGAPDHVHILYGMNPDISISKTVYELKRSSSLWINNQKILGFKFSWQEGYAAFTLNKAGIANLYKYIENQKAHHQKDSFRAEYLEILRNDEMEYHPEFLFEFFV